MKNIPARQILILCGILAVTFAVFSPTLRNGFVNWDDNVYVTDNAGIRDLSPRGLLRMATTFDVGNYHPLTMLSLALDHRLGGNDPFRYHLTSLLLHAGVAVLVYLFALLLGGSPGAAALTALLFAVHPLHVESVAWVSGRKDVLSALFFFASVNCYLLGTSGRRSRIAYAASLALFVCALLSKATTAVLPFILLVIDHYRSGKIDRKDVANKAPFVILAVAAGIVALLAQQLADSTRAENLFRNIVSGMAIAGNGLLIYFEKLFVPLRLSCIYEVPHPAGAVLKLPFLVPGLCALAGFAALFLAVRKYRVARFGYFFFLAAILPVLQILPVGDAVAADRYTYISFVGIFFSVGVVVSSFARSSRRLGTIAAVALVLGSFSLAAYQRCFVWKDSVALWTDAIRHYPRTSTAYLNRGIVFMDRGETVPGIADIKTAVVLNPGLALGYYNLGRAYLSAGEPGEAVNVLREYLAKDPGSSDGHVLLGCAYQSMGNYQAAVRLYRHALFLDPGNRDAAENLLDLRRAASPR